MPIVIVAPVTPVSEDDTVTAESTVTVSPAVSLFEVWLAVTTGAAIVWLLKVKRSAVDVAEVP